MAIINQDIELAINLLNKGELVAIPTETVYGLAANALDIGAVAKSYTIKNRPSFNPMIVHCKSIDQISEFVESLNELEITLFEQFSPGPLTILLKKNSSISDIITAGSAYAGFRIPNHVITLNLLHRLNFPLTAPSANKFGKISPTRAIDVKNQLGDEIKLILDGGNTEVGIESSVIKVLNNEIIIYREGAVTKEMLEQFAVVNYIENSEKLESPGRVKYHYSPDIPTFILSKDSNYSSNSLLIKYSEFERDFPKCNQIRLSPSGNLNQAATNLFRILNEANNSSFERIYIELVPNISIGRAINDKIRKAAAKYS